MTTQSPAGDTSHHNQPAWLVRHRNGWCALPLGAAPDPDACNDPTLCGYVVTMRSGSKRGRPDCPACLSILAGRDTAGGDQ